MNVAIYIVLLLCIGCDIKKEDVLVPYMTSSGSLEFKTVRQEDSVVISYGGAPHSFGPEYSEFYDPIVFGSNELSPSWSRELEYYYNDANNTTYGDDQRDFILRTPEMIVSFDTKHIMGFLSVDKEDHYKGPFRTDLANAAIKKFSAVKSRLSEDRKEVHVPVFNYYLIFDKRAFDPISPEHFAGVDLDAFQRGYLIDVHASE